MRPRPTFAQTFVRTFLVTVVVGFLAFGLGGCGGSLFGSGPAVAPVEPRPVVIDMFCTNSKKRVWSMQDTPLTRAEAKAWNRAVDKRCGTSGS